MFESLSNFGLKKKLWWKQTSMHSFFVSVYQLSASFFAVETGLELALPETQKLVFT